MRKLFIISILLLITNLSDAQHAGYKPVTDMAAFKQDFTAASQKIQTIKSDFLQEKNLAMLSDKIVSKGKFWFKKNNLVRMEYQQPFPCAWRRARMRTSCPPTLRRWSMPTMSPQMPTSAASGRASSVSRNPSRPRRNCCRLRTCTPTRSGLSNGWWVVRRRSCASI